MAAVALRELGSLSAAVGLPALARARGTDVLDPPMLVMHRVLD